MLAIIGRKQLRKPDSSSRLRGADRKRTVWLAGGGERLGRFIQQTDDFIRISKQRLTA